MSVITRASWADVTLAEYAALDIIRREDSEQLLNSYWDDVCAHDPFRGPGCEPTRLTPDGSDWLAGLRETVTTTLDERELIAAARDFARSMGTLCTMATHRMMRS